MDTIQKEELLCTKYRTVNKFLAAQGVKSYERDDLRHEVLIRAFKYLEQLKDPDKMDSWLWVICENVIRDNAKKQNADKKVAAYDENVLEAYYAKTDKDNSNNVVSIIDKYADQEVISKALHQLEPRAMAVFRFHYYLGYPLKEIAKASGMNYNTVKSLHQRGLRKLEIALRNEESNRKNG